MSSNANRLRNTGNKIVSNARNTVNKTANNINTVVQGGGGSWLTYFIMLLVLFFMGAGRYVSVDYWIERALYKEQRALSSTS